MDAAIKRLADLGMDWHEVACNVERLRVFISKVKLPTTEREALEAEMLSTPSLAYGYIQSLMLLNEDRTSDNTKKAIRCEDALAAEILMRVNFRNTRNERIRELLPMLKWDNVLSYAAVIHLSPKTSLTMGELNYMTNDGSPRKDY